MSHVTICQCLIRKNRRDYRIRVLLGRVLFGALLVVLLGCSTIPMSTSVALAQTSTSAAPGESSAMPAASELGESRSAEDNSQLMFELMIAELAGRRGQLDVALAGYLQACTRTDDPRVADRATRLAVFARQWSPAEQAARRWLELDPEAPDARDILAQVLLRQDKTDMAATEYGKIVENATDRQAALRQVQAELQRDQVSEQSLIVMRSLVAQFPDEPEAHLGLARLLLATNQRDEALEGVERSLAISPTYTDALLFRAQVLGAQGKVQQGVESLQAALLEQPGNTALRLGYAQLLVEAGRYDDVGIELDQLFEAAPEQADTLLTISLLALDSRRIDRAKAYLQQLLSTGEYPDQANFYLARISDQQQQYKAAIDYYNSVSPGELQLTAQIRVAELLALTGDLEAGRERLHELTATLPNPAFQPQLLTAESRLLQQAGRPAEAVDVLSKALVRFPDNGDLMYARALAADKAGDAPMLVQDLTRLIELEPDNAHALNALGYHFAENNIELDKAETLLEEAIALLPNDPAILDSLGWLRYRQGKFAESVTLLREAYRLYPDAEIAAHLSEVLWLSGAEGEARELLENALAESPEDDHLRQVMQKFME